MLASTTSAGAATEFRPHPRNACDYVNRDGLDDRKANLRNCTIAQNNANRRSASNASFQYIGVSRERRRNKWVAHIKINGDEKYLGSFDIEEDARNKAECRT
ncbi:MAG: AP2 domain-containing protein [Phycisphaerae bacterium]|nr:AP2 domain-containing protein [Phycisphaerae bacterium]